MKIVSIQEAYKRKFQRQKAIKRLEYHAAGHCVHIGQLSPGCYSCFTTDSFRLNMYSGARCNVRCLYCNVDPKESEPTRKQVRIFKSTVLKHSALPDYNPSAFSFSGGGEPLLYLDNIAKLMKLFHQIEQQTRKKPWYYLYTNGLLADTDVILRLRDLGFDEIRFHLGATNFSKRVYKNMAQAARYIKVVTVETPSWPPHRKRLFEMLGIIEDIGVKHLNIGEIEVNNFNYKRLSRLLPEAEIYQCLEMHLYDDGLVYDLIEKVLRKKYSYSVLDCNCFVKSIQRGNSKLVACQKIEGLCAEY